MSRAFACSFSFLATYRRSFVLQFRRDLPREAMTDPDVSLFVPVPFVGTPPKSLAQQYPVPQDPMLGEFLKLSPQEGKCCCVFKGHSPRWGLLAPEPTPAAYLSSLRPSTLIS